jgi:sugar lactone lactonase YvrE
MVRKLSSSGFATLVGGDRWFTPGGVAFDSAGTLYFSDTARGRIARVSSVSEPVNVVGGNAVGNYWGDGGNATNAGLSVPLGVAVDLSGNLYISDTGNSRVRKVTPEGIISTVAGTAVSGYSGDGGPASNAQLRGPAGLALDSSGNLYIADYLDNRVRKVSPGGIISTVAGKGDSNVPIGDGGPAIKAALAGPLGVTVDASGNLYIADTYFGLVRKVSPDGMITSIAGRNFYTNGLSDIGFPTDLASDLSGNIVAATMASGVRKIAPNGSVTTIVPQNELGITADSSGNLYVADGGLGGIGVAHVRRIAPDGSIADIAGNGVNGYSGDGGPALAASLSPAAAGITVDTAGNIYIADVFNNVIRVLRVVR